MSTSYTPAPLSGVDPFRAPAPRAKQELDECWFDQPASSRPMALRQSQAPSAPPPIGDNEADLWFR